MLERALRAAIGVASSVRSAAQVEPFLTDYRREMEERTKIVNISEWQQRAENDVSELPRQKRFFVVASSGYILVLAAAALALYVIYQAISLDLTTHPVVFASLGSAALYALVGRQLIQYGSQLTRKLSRIPQASNSTTQTEEQPASAEVLQLPVREPVQHAAADANALVLCPGCGLHYEFNLGQASCIACGHDVRAA